MTHSRVLFFESRNKRHNSSSLLFINYFKNLFGQDDMRFSEISQVWRLANFRYCLLFSNFARQEGGVSGRSQVCRDGNDDLGV